MQGAGSKIVVLYFEQLYVRCDMSDRGEVMA